MEVCFEEYHHENRFRKAWPLTVSPLHNSVTTTTIFVCELYDKLSSGDDVRVRLWYKTSTVVLFSRVDKVCAPKSQLTSAYYMGK